MSEIKYQGIIDLSVKNNSHTMAYEYVDKMADGKLLQVLEVGCSTGYFGSALKAAGHTVWGIEPNEDSAKIANEKLDYVYIGLVEDFIKTYPDRKFDVISFGDVLEHIAYPEEVLNQCHYLLVEGGAIVASVPNVSHVTVRSMLLEGRWEYSELGILDKTHLRFFTRETIEDLFYRSNYALVDIKAVTLPAEIAANICNIPYNQQSVNAVETFAKDNTKYDFQYVLLAVAKSATTGRGVELLSEKPKTKVLALALNIDQSHFNVRLGDPLRAWAKHYRGDLICKAMGECDEESLVWADVVVIQRHLDVNVIRIISKARQLGKRIVFEIDDLLINLPEFLSHHSAGLAGYASALGGALPQVDCLTVTTKRLGQQLEQYNRPISVIPNCVGADGLSPIDDAKWKNGVATLIVASTDAVLVDFVLPAIIELTKKNHLEVKVLVIGPPGNAFDKAGIKCERVPNFTYDEFKKFIRTVDNPIGIIPLDNSVFSSCKSPVKYFDYSLAGIPVICSNVAPYSDVVSTDKTGILVNNTTEEWITAIEQLVQSSLKRRELVLNAKDFVTKKYNILKAAHHWHQTLSQLNDGLFDYSRPITVSSIDTSVTQSKLLLTYLVRPTSYKAALGVLKREGLKGIMNRLFPRSF